MTLDEQIRAIVREELAKLLAEREASSEWLSAYDAAQILGVHPKTMRKWIREGKIEGKRTEGGRHRVRRADLEAFLDRGSRNDNMTPEQLARAKFG